MTYAAGSKTVSPALTKDETDHLFSVVEAWRADPANVAACGCQGNGALQILDASVRPYAEWYVITCSACARRDVLNRPTGRPRFAEEL